MGQSGIMNYLMTNEGLLAMREEWRDSCIKEAFPPFNYDEYNGWKNTKKRLEHY